MSFRPKKAVALSEAEGDAKHREVEKSIKKQISRLTPLLSCESKKGSSLEMTIYGVFYKAI